AVPPHRPQDDVTGEMPTGEDAHGSDYFTPVFLLPQLCNSTNVSIIQGWEDKKTGTPAKAQMRATLQVAKVFSTKTIALTLKITGRKASIIPTM
ncbi:hypothetical protein MHK11_11455, partial [Corynebacterium aurimucosum]|nr:hypothetical protein [Corynebacterium aurimucosum]